MIATSDLHVGSLLEAPIYAPGADSPLLQAGQVFTDHHRRLLGELGVTWLTVGAGEPVVTPGPTYEPLMPTRVSVERLLTRQPASTPATTPVQLTPKLLKALQDAGVQEVEVLLGHQDQLRSQSDAAQPEIGRILRRVLDANRRTPVPEKRAVDPDNGRRAAFALDTAIERLTWSASVSELLITHGLRPGFLGPAIEVGLLTAIVGAELGWSNDALAEAAIGALLADLGMLLIAPGIIQKPGVLTAEERVEVERHPGLGADLLRTLPGIGESAARIAHQHHKRHDGGGYPMGLVGRQIEPVAQLAGLSQFYLAAITGRNYRAPLGPRTAMKLIGETAGGAVDPALAGTFVRSIDPHPIGTSVRLSTGDCATIAGGTVNRPLVEIASDGRARTFALQEGVEITVIGD